jgi:hypothetical protein
MGKETGKTSASCNYELDLCGNGVDNHVLKISLVLAMQAVPTPPNKLKDASNNEFDILPWPTEKWQAFRLSVQSQGTLWHKRFVLVPPTTCSKLRYSEYLGRLKYMPNVECHFSLSVQESTAGANKTIKVANLDVSKLPATTAQDSGAFRSHAALYDSLDSVVHVFQIPDDVGNTHPITHYTIPHEVGHAIGQPHIGVLKKTVACSNKPDKNSIECYGWGEKPTISENIMGYGTKFDVVNAQPWLDVMTKITSTAATDWTVEVGSYKGPRLTYEA